MLWITDEHSYEREHEKADRIMLLYKQYMMGEQLPINASLPYALAPSLVEEFPGIKSAIRFSWHAAVVGIGEEVYLERTIAAVDPEYFNMFTFESVQCPPLSSAILSKHFRTLE